MSNFLRQIEISRTFLRTKWMEEKLGKFQFVVEIAHKAVYSTFPINKAETNKIKFFYRVGVLGLSH